MHDTARRQRGGMKYLKLTPLPVGVVELTLRCDALEAIAQTVKFPGVTRAVGQGVTGRFLKIRHTPIAKSSPASFWRTSWLSI